MLPKAEEVLLLRFLKRLVKSRYDLYSQVLNEIWNILSENKTEIVAIAF